MSRAREQLEALRDQIVGTMRGAIIKSINHVNELFHTNSYEHGFWDDLEEMKTYLPGKFHTRFDRLVMAEKIALMHSELSEALEGVRNDPTRPDEHIPKYTTLEAEMADLRIRMGDFEHKYGLRAGEATLAKHEFNINRPFKHGKIS